MAQWQKKCVNGNNPEILSNMQKTNPKSYKRDQEEGLKSYADMTMYTIDPARLVPIRCHHKLPAAIVTSLTLATSDESFSLQWLKCMQLAHARTTMSSLGPRPSASASLVF